MKAQIIPIKNITPDAAQPRKHFDAVAMNALRESIKKEGIISPLVVQDMGGESYLLVDGERRYRNAIALGMKEVPVIIEPPTSKANRLTRQFQIQEMHENWTPVEKAVALLDLSKEIGLSLSETCAMLHITETNTRRYLAFSRIIDKEAYIRSEIPLDYARQISSVVNSVENLHFSTLKKPFGHNERKKLEAKLVRSVVDGVIQRRVHFTRLKDAFTKNPKLIERFMGSNKDTPDSLYLESKAEGAYALRNLMYSGRYIETYGKRFLELRDVALTHDQILALKRARAILDQVVSLAE